MFEWEVVAVLQEAADREQIIERVAALDIGKAEVVCCVRLPGPGRRRVQEVGTHSTMVGSLAELANRLVGLGIERVVMEATSDYWRPPFYLFEAHGLRPWLVNAKDVKHLPGRPKTDVLDAVWLCKVAERQMLRPSFVPPADIRGLRDLTRYRADLVGVRNAEKNRVEKLLEDACIKLSVVASDIFGVSGRDDAGRDDRRGARPAGPRGDGAVPDAAQDRAAGARRRAAGRDLRRAPPFPAGPDARRIDRTDADIADLDTRIEEHLAPFGDSVARLDEIPGVGPTAAAIIIAEIGLDMTRFPTPGHLASWAKFAPGIKVLGRQEQGQRIDRARQQVPRRVLGEAAVGASRTNTFLGARYRRIARRRGKKKAMVAVGRSILIIAWQLLSDPGVRFHDLGPDHYDRHRGTDARKRNHIRQLEALGYRVTVEPAA